MRALAVLAAAAVGMFFAFGSWLAIHFELSGFGRDDADPRPAYLAALVAAFALCILVPAFLWRKLLPHSAPAWALVAVPLALGVLAIFGLR